MPENNERYLDENLTEEEKESGRTRLPSPEEEGMEADSTDRDRERQQSERLNPDRPDEFGDGDRRS
jgi:hypothetical protein